MRKSFFALLALIPLVLDAGQLPDEYLITYGVPDAPTQIVEYFSFSCPYCIQLFREDFSHIKERHIDTNEVSWVFHPVPVDLLTVQAMACLDQLPNAEKRIFLEEILHEAGEEDPLDLSLLMRKIMEVCGKATPNLQDMDALEQTAAFQAAFEFVSGGVDLEGVPSIAVNGRTLPGEVPDKLTVASLLTAFEPRIESDD